MAALVVALVFCLLGAGCGSGESPPSDARRGEVAEAPGQANDSDRMEPGPSRLEHGIPVGWSLDQPGAEAAALAFVRSTSVIARSGPLTRRDAVLTLSLIHI